MLQFLLYSFIFYFVLRDKPRAKFLDSPYSRCNKMLNDIACFYYALLAHFYWILNNSKLILKIRCWAVKTFNTKCFSILVILCELKSDIIAWLRFYLCYCPVINPNVMVMDGYMYLCVHNANNLGRYLCLFSTSFLIELRLI